MSIAAPHLILKVRGCGFDSAKMAVDFLKSESYNIKKKRVAMTA